MHTNYFFSRYVSWTAYILRYHNKTVEPIPLPGAPFSHYYAQEVSDEGIIMETDIGIKEVSIYLVAAYMMCPDKFRSYNQASSTLTSWTTRALTNLRQYIILYTIVRGHEIVTKCLANKCNI